MLREWLEKDGDSELYILQVLFARMGELNSGNASTYSEKLMQSKLKEKYRDHIYFTNQSQNHGITKDLVGLNL